MTKSYEVYVCKLDDEIVYVGQGEKGRHRHCNSGVTHVYELNKVHFEGGSVDVNVVLVSAMKKEVLKLEKELILKYRPKFNKVHNQSTRGKQARDSIHVKNKLCKYIDGVNWDKKQKIKCKELVVEFWKFYYYVDIMDGSIRLLSRDDYKRLYKPLLVQLARWLTSGEKKYSEDHYCNLFYNAYLNSYGVDLHQLKKDQSKRHRNN